MLSLAGQTASLGLKGVIRLYQWTLAPVLGSNCRFAPSCSAYAYEAIATHGPLHGLWLAAARIVRCHPWGGSGYDPVPPVADSSRPRRA